MSLSTTEQTDDDWLHENYPNFDVDDYEFAERVSIKVEAGIELNEARRQALGDLVCRSVASALKESIVWSMSYKIEEYING